MTGLLDLAQDPAPAAGPPPAATAPVLSVEGFEGPLDWLLDLARSRKIDLARLSIAALIQTFCDALETVLRAERSRRARAGQATGRPAAPGRQAPELASWADWLVMAATLAQLRSRLLLPPGEPGARAATQAAETLRRQLLMRSQAGAAADWLERRLQLGRHVFPRGMPERQAPARVADLTDLLRACLLALRLPEERAASHRPGPRPFWRVPDAMARIEALLSDLPDGSALSAFLPKPWGAPAHDLQCRAAVASTLLAGLELARRGALTLQQDEPWLPVRVHGNDRAATAPVETAQTK